MSKNRRRPQPARVALYAAHISVRAAAEQMDGVSVGHLHNAINGTAVPSPALREQLPALLGIPLSDLFDADLLAKEWRGSNDYASAKYRRAGESK